MDQGMYARILLLGLILCTGLSDPGLISSVATAEESASSGSAPDTRRVPAMREATYRSLAEAQQLVDDSKPAEALPLLDRLLNRRGLNKYELAQVWNTMAYAYYTLDDIPNTIRAYEKVLVQEQITLALEMSALRSLFQLYYADEKYDTALSYIDRWLALNDVPDPNILFIKATCYYQMERYDDSLKFALLTEQVAREQSREIKENWLYMQVVLYNEKQEYAKVIPILKRLVVAFPKKQYWMHLAGMYSEVNQEDKALGAYYAAYKQGMFVRESEVVMLAQRLLNSEVPYEAAMVVQQGMKDGLVERNEKNLRLLGQSWTMAQEMPRAIQTWREAAKVAETGELYYRLAQALAQEDKHKEAVEAYQNAFKKGDLERPRDVRFWLAISLMQIEKWDDAIAAFNEAARDPSKKKQCDQYIRYVKGEVRRQTELARMEKELSRM
jgi:tetratricopeptide (TPR) repeat protein